MIHVLVVEDSPVVRDLLVYLLNSDPKIRVVGTATNGEEALDAVQRKKPDVVTMDIHMPKIDGFEATRRIMETHPTPIVIVSGSSTAQEVANTFHAMEAGALAIVPRPKGIGHPDYESTAKELVQTVKLMSEVKVVRRWARKRAAPEPVVAAVAAPSLGTSTDVRIVAVGASTGGPPALQTILLGLHKDFPVPILIVQHMASGFIQGFADWLSQSTGFPVHIAQHGEPLLSSHVYVSPDNYHMGVAIGGRILLSQTEFENGLRPSVSYLFRSVVNLYGPHAVGVLLTGMGKDGAEGLQEIKERGGITIAQDRESSVVYGMPGEAMRLDAAKFVLSPDQIAATLTRLVNKR